MIYRGKVLNRGVILVLHFKACVKIIYYFNYIIWQSLFNVSSIIHSNIFLKYASTIPPVGWVLQTLSLSPPIDIAFLIAPSKSFASKHKL